MNVFYSGSSASTAQGSPAVLLPTMNPSLNMDSLDNLRANNHQTIHYQQAYDQYIYDDSYRAIIDYEFEVPSIVFDHSSQMYILNLTNDWIVFGFDTADAYAQALNWPQSGIAMIMQGECLSTNANDLYLLNGFVYDASALTVAANFTPAEISNVSSNVNVTIGENSNSTSNGNGTVGGNSNSTSNRNVIVRRNSESTSNRKVTVGKNSKSSLKKVRWIPKSFRMT